MRFLPTGILVVFLLPAYALALLAPMPGNPNSERFILPREGTWEGHDWGTIKLSADSSGAIGGSYDDTYVDDVGVVRLRWDSEEANWIGTWSEPGIKRGGSMYELKISRNGKVITGRYKTDAAGGRPPKENVPLRWEWKG